MTKSRNAIAILIALVAFIVLADLYIFRARAPLPTAAAAVPQPNPAIQARLLQAQREAVAKQAAQQAARTQVCKNVLERAVASGMIFQWESNDEALFVEVGRSWRSLRFEQKEALAASIACALHPEFGISFQDRYTHKTVARFAESRLIVE